MKQQTRLCIIQGGHFSISKGGAQYQAKVLVDALVAAGDFDVTYITRNVAADYTPNGYSIDKLTPGRWLRRLGFVADTRQLQKKLHAHQPDVIYQQGLKGHTGIAARYARSAGARFVFHVASDFDVLPAAELTSYDFKSVSGVDKKLGEWGLRRADDVVVQTKVQAGLLSQHYQKSASLLVKNFHPLPTEDVERADKIRFIWVANFKAVKRPQLFVQMAQHFADRNDCDFVMIGRAGDGASYDDLHKDIKALPNLNYLGELPQDEVNQEIARSHVLVNTSSMEGFPNTFVQAWMRGLPVMTAGVNTDGLFDSKELGVCEIDFPRFLKQAELMITNPEIRINMAKAGKAYALANHSLVNVEPLISLLRMS